MQGAEMKNPRYAKMKTKHLVEIEFHKRAIQRLEIADALEYFFMWICFLVSPHSGGKDG